MLRFHNKTHHDCQGNDEHTSLVMAAGSSRAIIKSEAKKLKMRLVTSVQTVFSKCLVSAACVSSEKQRCFIKVNVQEKLWESMKEKKY